MHVNIRFVILRACKKGMKLPVVVTSISHHEVGVDDITFVSCPILHVYTQLVVA